MLKKNPKLLRNPFGRMGLLVMLFVAMLSPMGEAQPPREPVTAPLHPMLAIIASAEKTITATTNNPFDVNTYPEGFAAIEQTVKENNGLALIARVVDTEGKPINRADFHTGSVYEPFLLPEMTMTPIATAATWSGGWFRTGNILTTVAGRQVLGHIQSRNIDAPIKFFVFTATNRPIVIDVPVTPGKVYYAQVVLPKTSESELVSISGIILDTEDNPIGDVRVNLRVRGGTGATASLRQTTADSDGRFAFEKVARQSYWISANVSGYTPVPVPDIPVEKLRENQVLRYYKQRNVEIEYVYQPDGSRDFTKGDLQPRTVTLKAADYTAGFRFATGEVARGGGNVPQDISYGDRFGNLAFHQRLFNRTIGNGFYDAGEVPFESITEADARPEVYPRPPETPLLPAKLNHVYVVKTIDGNYVKFVVREIK